MRPQLFIIPSLAVLCAMPLMASETNPAPQPAAQPAPPIPAVMIPTGLPSAAEVSALMDSAIAYLRSQQQPSGAFVPGNKFIFGVTGLATLALLDAGVSKDDPQIVKAVAFIMQHRQPDGGFYVPVEGLGNYGTSIALQVLVKVGGDPAVIKGAQDYLFGIQNKGDVKGKEYNKGGIGYGSRGAGNEDISNTSFAVTALRASGVPATDERLQAALKFLQNCQDLSVVNQQPWVKNSGGAVYSPDETKAGGSFYEHKPGEPLPQMNPYGSVTYALIASYLTLDVKPEDPRIKAALKWVTSNWRLDVNPGMPKSEKKDQTGEGLFYYYGAMAKTFDLLNHEQVTLADGKVVDWRTDLFHTLKAKEKNAAVGSSWTNPADRWAEGMPQLVTSYVLQTLARVKASLPAAK